MKNVLFQKELMVIFLLGLFISSCKEKKDNNFRDKAGNKYTLADVNCFQLFYSDLEKWEQNGWTKPGTSTSIEKILFSPRPGVDPTTIEVIAYPLDSKGAHLPDGDLKMYRNKTCFEGIDNISFAMNYVDFRPLGIVDESGYLTDFSFIRLTPINVPTQALTFDLDVIKKSSGVEQSRYHIVSNPCPPCQYCNPPNCPPPQPIDTTSNGDTLRTKTAN